jgi:hypothetical protein
MTQDEFKFQFRRLCDGTKHEATQEQFDAWWSRLQHVRSDDWREAVTTLLLAGRFPYPDKVNDAIDAAVSARRTKERITERTDADKFFQGKTKPAGITEQERAYNLFRMGLVVRSFNQDYGDRCKSAFWREESPGEVCPDCAKRKQTFSQVQADGLAEWIADPAHANWAMTMLAGPCQFHTGPHTLHRCISDELHYWMERAAGKSERDAREAVVGVPA